MASIESIQTIYLPAELYSPAEVVPSGNRPMIKYGPELYIVFNNVAQLSDLQQKISEYLDSEKARDVQSSRRSHETRL